MHTKIQRYIIGTLIASVILGISLYIGARALWGEHYLVFFKGIMKNPTQVGAITPCSVFVAKELTRYIEQELPMKRSVRILEVGGGSGVISVQLAKLIAHYPESRLDIIEIDPEYCSVLKKRFETNRQVNVHCMSVTDFSSDYPYDYIVSTLPFNVMERPLLDDIYKTYIHLIKNEGRISYVEHMWLPDMKKYLLSDKERVLYDEKRSFINAFRDAYLIETKKVLVNITPLLVFHLKVTK